jgi:urease accessory protein
VKKYLIAAALSVLAGPAFAHTGTGAATHGLIHGLMHPIGGTDHLLAMLAVGVWSALVMPARAWMAPVAFVTAMLMGAGLAAFGLALPMVELGIVASVIALGVMIAFRLDVGLVAGAALVGLFAMFHGNAHGLEASGSMLTYMAGFSLSTAALHVLGLGIGWAAARMQFAAPALGTGVAAAGLFLLVA